MVRIFKSIVLALSLLTVAATAAQAQVTVQGVPVEYGLSFQEPATPIMERAVGQFNVFILPLMAAVTVFVLVLLLWTCWRFRERDGHQPGNFTHNTRIEIIWTVVPILILVVMFVPAMRFLYYNENGPDMLINGERGNDKHAELVMQVTGNQWNWTYEYLLYRDENGVETDVSGIEFTANMLPQDALLADTRRDGSLYKGETDYHVLIPSNTVVRFNVTASDVLHAFAMPAFGMKVDAIKDDSLFQKVGLQNGDIITEVNGVVVDRLEATSRIMNELSTAEELILGYERNGQIYSFEGSPDELMGN